MNFGGILFVFKAVFVEINLENSFGREKIFLILNFLFFWLINKRFLKDLIRRLDAKVLDS